MPSQPAETPAGLAPLPRVLILGCGALARELVALVRGGGFTNVEISCLPASLHNRPERIPDAVGRRLREARGRYDRIFVAYADCGTGGRLDAVLAEEGVERLPGAHCYEFFAGAARFARLADEEPGTFYLTDYLARHFDRVVIASLGLDRRPDLLPAYFGNYRRVVYLSQTDDPGLLEAARRAADRLGLEFRHEPTGFGLLAGAVIAAGGSETAAGGSAVAGSRAAFDRAAAVTARAAGAVA